MAARKTTPETHPEEPNDSVVRRTFLALSVAVAFAAALWFLYEIREIVAWLLVALVLALALTPLVEWLHRRLRLRRGLACGLAVLLLLGVSVGAIGAAVTQLVNESDQFVNNLPTIIEETNRFEPVRDFNERFQVDAKILEARNELPQFLTGADSPLIDTAKETFSAVFAIIIILAMTFFMLMEGPEAWRRSVKVLRPRDAKRVYRTGKKINEAITGFVYGNLIITLIAGTAAFITLTIFGIPYALPIAVVAGLFCLVPIVGSSIATIIMAVIALSEGVFDALGVFLLFGSYQVIESNFIVPAIYARAVKLPPLVILVATIVGASLAGVVGVLLAIPAAAMVQIIIIELLRGTATGRRAHLARG